MKVKGVYNDKARKGEPVEYTPEEKVPLAVMDAVKSSAEKGYLQYVEGGKDGVEFSDFHFVKNSVPLPNKRSWENNAYSAKGSVKVRRLKVEGDKLRPVVEKEFKIKFRDCCDENGMPDLKVDSFEMM